MVVGLAVAGLAALACGGDWRSYRTQTGLGHVQRLTEAVEALPDPPGEALELLEAARADVLADRYTTLELAAFVAAFDDALADGGITEAELAVLTAQRDRIRAVDDGG